VRQTLLRVGIIGLWVAAGIAAFTQPFVPRQAEHYEDIFTFMLTLAAVVTLRSVAQRAHRSSADVARNEARRLGNIVETTALVREARHSKNRAKRTEAGIVSLVIEGRRVGVKVEDNTPINIAAVQAAMHDVGESAS
jgi:hypothetical protein